MVAAPARPVPERPRLRYDPKDLRLGPVEYVSRAPLGGYPKWYLRAGGWLHSLLFEIEGDHSDYAEFDIELYGYAEKPMQTMHWPPYMPEWQPRFMMLLETPIPNQNSASLYGVTIKSDKACTITGRQIWHPRAHP